MKKDGVKSVAGLNAGGGAWCLSISVAKQCSGKEGDMQKGVSE